ncbi:MAG TPA: RNA polymerase sigma factor [Polyangia bacterium]
MRSRAGNVLESTASPTGMMGAVLDFDAVYEDLVEFAWRTVRRMGVRAADADDVVQDVFVIVHRRLAEFEGRAQLKTWVFKILVHEVRHYWRNHQRKPGDRAGEDVTLLQTLLADRESGPAASLERVEALRILDRLLAGLDEDKREVFVLAEIEQMTAVEIAEIVDANANTVASRLRAARQDFEKALARFRAHELGRQS